MRFILIFFVFMGFAFYQLSGGAEFEPRTSRGDVELVRDTVHHASVRDVTLPARDKVEALLASTEVVRLEPTAVAEQIKAAEAATRVDALGVNEAESSEAVTDLAFRFNQMSAQSGQTSDAEVQLASLADGAGNFPQPLFLETAPGATGGISAAVTAAVTSGDEAAAPEPRLDIREVTGSRVNMRQGPGTTYAVVGTLYYDDQVEILDDLGDGWVQLRKVGSDRIGWMAARFVGKPVR